MKPINFRLHSLLAALLFTAVSLPVTAPAASAASASNDLATLTQQLNSDQAKLSDLNDRVERADAAVDGLNHKIAADQQSEAELGQRLASLARLEYQQPVLTLSRVLEARSLDQLLSDMAQAQLVARKQQTMLNQTRELRRQDEQARSEVAAKAVEVKATRDQAAQIAARTQTLWQSANDATVRSRAQTVVQQAFTSVNATSGPNHFSYGYCTWYVANRRYVPWFGNAAEWWPNARAYGYAEGQTPAVGAIMVTQESGPGHVAYVESVNGSSFTVSEMNYAGWNVVSSRTITPGSRVPILGFIYGHP
jgi:surface antigen